MDFFFWDKILLCDPSYFPSHYVDWLTGPALASAYRMLGLPPPYPVDFIFWKFKSFVLGSGAHIFNPRTREGERVFIIVYFSDSDSWYFISPQKRIIEKGRTISLQDGWDIGKSLKADHIFQYGYEF